MSIAQAIAAYMDTFDGSLPGAEIEKLNELGVHTVNNVDGEYSDLFLDVPYANVNGDDQTIDVQLSLYWPERGFYVMVGNNTGDGFNPMGEVPGNELTTLEGAVHMSASRAPSRTLSRLLVQHCTSDRLLRNKLAELEKHFRSRAEASASTPLAEAG